MFPSRSTIKLTTVKLNIHKRVHYWNLNNSKSFLINSGKGFTRQQSKIDCCRRTTLVWILSCDLLPNGLSFKVKNTCSCPGNRSLIPMFSLRKKINPGLLWNPMIGRFLNFQTNPVKTPVCMPSNKSTIQ